jgi:hypothetical protein
VRIDTGSCATSGTAQEGPYADAKCLRELRTLSTVLVYAVKPPAGGAAAMELV